MDPGLLIALWEKEKLLIMSNFSFSHKVFYLLEFVPFSLNLKVSSANYLSLEAFVVFERVIPFPNTF